MTTEAITIEQRLGRGKIRASRSRSLGTKLTLLEERELVRAAETEGKSASEWAREVLLREARGSARTDALFTEVVALRMMLQSFLKPVCCGEVITQDDFSAEMMSIRTTKQKTASELLRQYSAATTTEAGR